MLVAKKIEIKKAKAFKAHIKYIYIYIYIYMNVIYTRFFLEKKNDIDWNGLALEAGNHSPLKPNIDATLRKLWCQLNTPYSLKWT